MAKACWLQRLLVGVRVVLDLRDWLSPAGTRFMAPKHSRLARALGGWSSEPGCLASCLDRLSFNATPIPSEDDSCRESLMAC